VKRAQDSLAVITNEQGEFDAVMTDLDALREEYEEWQGNLPESLMETTLYEKLDEVVNLDFSSLNSELEGWCAEAEDLLEEAEGVDLPRGWGRD